MEKAIQHQQLVISGESGDVQGKTVGSWKERLPELLQGYQNYCKAIRRRTF